MDGGDGCDPRGRVICDFFDRGEVKPGEEVVVLAIIADLEICFFGGGAVAVVVEFVESKGESAFPPTEDEGACFGGADGIWRWFESDIEQNGYEDMCLF